MSKRNPFVSDVFTCQYHQASGAVVNVPLLVSSRSWVRTLPFPQSMFYAFFSWMKLNLPSLPVSIGITAAAIVHFRSRRMRTSVDSDSESSSESKKRDCIFWEMQSKFGKSGTKKLGLSQKFHLLRKFREKNNFPGLSQRAESSLKALCKSRLQHIASS